MEDAHLVEQHNSNAAAFAFADFGAEPAEQGFNVLPSDVRAGRVCEDGFQRPLMRALHLYMVPDTGTVRNIGEVIGEVW